VVGSVLVVAVKGGPVEVLGAGHAAAPPLARERMPIAVFRRASRFTLQRFMAGCARLFRSYLTLGSGLMIVYAISVTGYLSFVVYGYRAAGGRYLVIGWTFIAAAAAALLVVWFTL